MFYVYLLRSLDANWVYVGNTLDIDIRFDNHNSGRVKSTKAHRPFQLIFVQCLDTRSEARDLEKFLKIRWNKENLLDLFKF